MALPLACPAGLDDLLLLLVKAVPLVPGLELDGGHVGLVCLDMLSVVLVLGGPDIVLHHLDLHFGLEELQRQQNIMIYFQFNSF